jgi:hypothetical protein
MFRLYTGQETIGAAITKVIQVFHKPVLVKVRSPTRREIDPATVMFRMG